MNIFSLLIGLIEGLIVFVGTLVAGYFMSFAIKMWMRDNEHEDLRQIGKDIRAGRAEPDDIRVRKGLRYNERTGEWTTTMSPGDIMVQRVIK